MPTVFITGCSSGLGLEFARQYLELGWSVIATCRQPERASALANLRSPRLQILSLDVGDGQSVRAVSTSLHGTPIDVLINNAGVLGGTLPQQTLGSLDFELGQAVMDVNCFGPLRISEALLPNVESGTQKKIIGIASGNGSLTATSREAAGGMYFYRTSKAAMHIALLALSRDVLSRGIAVRLLSPGLVDSNFGDSAKIDKSKIKGMLTPQQSVSKMIPLIDSLIVSESGSWKRYTGDDVPW